MVVLEEPIARVLPFTMGDQLYLDTREFHGPDTTPEQQQRGRSAGWYTRWSMASVPRELWCDLSTRRARSREGRGGTFDLTEEETLGDLEPLFFATFQGEKCLNAFGLYAIQLTEDGSGYSIRCRVIPGAMQVRHDYQAWASAFSDLMEFLAGYEFLLTDSKSLMVSQVDAVCTAGGDATNADKRAAAFKVETARRSELTVTSYRAEDRSGWSLVGVSG